MCLGPKVRKDLWKCAFTGKASPLAANETLGYAPRYASTQSGGFDMLTRLLPSAMEPDKAPVVRTASRHH